jgi:hypothetical protein
MSRKIKENWMWFPNSKMFEQMVQMVSQVQDAKNQALSVKKALFQQYKLNSKTVDQLFSAQKGKSKDRGQGPSESTRNLEDEQREEPPPVVTVQALPVVMPPITEPPQVEPIPSIGGKPPMRAQSPQAVYNTTHDIHR